MSDAVSTTPSSTHPTLSIDCPDQPTDRRYQQHHSSVHTADARESTTRSSHETPSFVAPSHYLRPRGALEKTTSGSGAKAARSMTQADVEQVEGLVSVACRMRVRESCRADGPFNHSAQFVPFSRSAGVTMSFLSVSA